MKYLTDYTEKNISEILEKNGAFFAFGDKQFNEQKKPDTEYISLGAGLVCPKDNADKVYKGIEKAHFNGIRQDMAENGKDNIIMRELANHEAYYTGDIESTAEALGGYGFTIDDIQAVFKREKDNNNNY